MIVAYCHIVNYLYAFIFPVDIHCTLYIIILQTIYLPISLNVGNLERKKRLEKAKLNGFLILGDNNLY